MLRLLLLSLLSKEIRGRLLHEDAVMVTIGSPPPPVPPAPVLEMPPPPTPPIPAPGVEPPIISSPALPQAPIRPLDPPPLLAPPALLLQQSPPVLLAPVLDTLSLKINPTSTPSSQTGYVKLFYLLLTILCTFGFYLVYRLLLKMRVKKN